MVKNLVDRFVFAFHLAEMSRLKLILVDGNGEESDLGTVPFETDIAIPPMAAAIAEQLTEKADPAPVQESLPERTSRRYWVSPVGKATWKDAASQLCPESDTLCASLETANDYVQPQ